MTRCPKCQSNLSLLRRGGKAREARCPRCRSVFSPSELGIDVDSAEAAVQVSASVGLQGSSIGDPASDQKTRIIRRRYYSRARLPKNLPPSKKRRRRKRRKSFSRLDVAKIVFGGLLAFPVAQLILWWGFAKDPFAMGPAAAQWVPFVVPFSLRGESPVPKVEAPEYTSHPKSSLLQGQPFGFARPANKSGPAELQKGMLRKSSNPLQKSETPPVRDAEDQLPK